MDGLYLGSNLEPLQSIGEGKPYQEITYLLKSDKFEHAELAAYSITGTEGRIVSINCLFQTNDPAFLQKILFFRNFDFYKNPGTFTDGLILSAYHGIGFSELDLEEFAKLREFYLQPIEA